VGVGSVFNVVADCALIGHMRVSDRYGRCEYSQIRCSALTDTFQILRFVQEFLCSGTLVLWMMRAVVNVRFHKS
jgi:hypothetical protein